MSYIKSYEEFNLNEAKWSNIMKDVRKAPQPPFSVVAITNGKVVGQTNDIKIADAIPAHYEDLKKKYPSAKISIENGEGLSVFNESADMLPSWEVLIGLATAMGAIDLAQAVKDGEGSIIKDLVKLISADVVKKMKRAGNDVKDIIDILKGEPKIKKAIKDADDKISESLDEAKGIKLTDWDYTGTVGIGKKNWIYFQMPGSERDNIKYYVEVTPAEYKQYTDGGKPKEKLVYKLAYSGDALDAKQFDKQKGKKSGFQQYLDDGGRMWDHNEHDNTDDTLSEAKAFGVKDILKAFKNTKDWGDTAEQSYMKGGNLIYVDTWFYGQDKAMKDLKTSWEPGGDNYKYWNEKHGVTFKIVDTFSEIKASGRHKKLTSDGIVGVVLEVTPGKVSESINEGQIEALLGDPMMDKKWADKTKKLSKSQLKKEQDKLHKAGFGFGNVWSGSKENMIKFQYVSALLEESLDEMKRDQTGWSRVIVRDTGEVIMDQVPKRIALAMAAKNKGWITQLIPEDEIEESVSEGLRKGPSKSGIKRLIKDVEEMLDTEIDANGDPLTNETEMILQKELKRLNSLLRESLTEAMKRWNKSSVKDVQKWFQFSAPHPKGDGDGIAPRKDVQKRWEAILSKKFDAPVDLSKVKNLTRDNEIRIVFKHDGEIYRLRKMGEGSKSASYSLQLLKKGAKLESVDLNEGVIPLVNEESSKGWVNVKVDSKHGDGEFMVSKEDFLGTADGEKVKVFSKETDYIEVPKSDVTLNESTEQINEAKKTKEDQKFWIAKSKMMANVGTIKKGEIFISSGKPVRRKFQGDEGSFYGTEVDVELADPRFEYHEGLDPVDFKNIFREVDPNKDTAAMKKLNKWGLVDVGTQYYVGTFSKLRGQSSKDAATNMLAKMIPTKAESPNMAVKKVKGNGSSGTMYEVGRGITVVMKWKDIFEIVLDEKTKDIKPQALVNKLKKPVYSRMGKEVIILKESSLTEGILSYENYFSVNEGKDTLWDFAEANLDKHKNGKAFVDAAVEAGFTTEDAESILGDLTLGDGLGLIAKWAKKVKADK